MKYTVTSEVFALDPNLRFGIVIAKGLRNSHSNSSDIQRLRHAENLVRQRIDQTSLRTWPTISFYRDLMNKAGINPNRYPVSVEAMAKRILKGDSLPSINALVDLCNAVSLENLITLGAHDLDDIHEDLSVRFASGSERFMPFGHQEEESVEAGELIFVSGEQVQTRKWIWRQSELGKTSIKSSRIIFQLVGNSQPSNLVLLKALESIQKLVLHRFQGECTTFIIEPTNPSITFSK